MRGTRVNIKHIKNIIENSLQSFFYFVLELVITEKIFDRESFLKSYESRLKGVQYNRPIPLNYLVSDFAWFIPKFSGRTN